MHRRAFMGQALATPLLIPAWKSAPPKAYLGELAELMKYASVPGMVVGSMRGHKTAWIESFGVCEAGTTRPVTGATVFQAASLTKQVTAHAAHALRAEGKLDFDKPLVDYVDDLPNEAARSVTLRQVLSHSSGFPNWRFAERGKAAPDLKPAFAPGSKFQYSGEGYCYLQRVMEQVSGQGFGRLIRERVFAPLGMASSSLVWDPAASDRTAQPHNRAGDMRAGRFDAPRSLRTWTERAGKALDDLRWDDTATWVGESDRPVVPDSFLPNAAASMLTTAEDYAKFVAAAMKTPGLTAPVVKINDSLSWGLGWGIERAAGHTYLWQWGDNPGYKNLVLAEPATGDAIFVFTNGDGGARVYDRVITRATGHEHPVFFWL